MFGELALSERAIADQGILSFGSATADANFTVDGAPILIAEGSADFEAIATNVTVGVGVLVGLLEASFDFVQTSDLTRFGVVSLDMIADTVQSTNGLFVASGVSEQDAAFIQASAANSIFSGESEQVIQFVESCVANAVYSANSELDFNFIQSLLPTLIKTADVEIESVFVQTMNAGLVKLSGDLIITAIMVQTTDGRLYWDIWSGSPNGSPTENWTPITPTGGTWTEINASAIISTWTEKVV